MPTAINAVLLVQADVGPMPSQEVGQRQELWTKLVAAQDVALRAGTDAEEARGRLAASLRQVTALESESRQLREQLRASEGARGELEAACDSLLEQHRLLEEAKSRVQEQVCYS